MGTNGLGAEKNRTWRRQLSTAIISCLMAKRVLEEESGDDGNEYEVC